jgi:hypothetical protein
MFLYSSPPVFVSRYDRKPKNVTVGQLHIPFNAVALSFRRIADTVYGAPCFSPDDSSYEPFETQESSKTIAIERKSAPCATSDVGAPEQIGPAVKSYLLKRKKWIEKKKAGEIVDV